MNSPTLNYLNSEITLKVNDQPTHFTTIKTQGTLVSALCRTAYLPDSSYELSWKSDLVESVGKVFDMASEVNVINDSAKNGNFVGDCEGAHVTGVMTIRLTLCPKSSLPTRDSEEGETYCTFFITLISTTPFEYDEMKGPIVPVTEEVDPSMTHLGKKAGKGKGKGNVVKGAKKDKVVKPIKIKVQGVPKVKKEKVEKARKEKVVKVQTPKKELPAIVID